MHSGILPASSGTAQTGRMHPRRPRRATLLALAAALVLSGCSMGGSQPRGSAATPSGSASPATAAATTTAAPPATSATSPTRSLPSGVPGTPRDVVTGLDVPWSIAVLPDGSALLSLRDEARILRVRTDGTKTPVAAPGPGGKIPDVAPSGEGGLLGLAVSPDDATQVFVYATTAQDNRVTRWTLQGDALTDPRLLLSGIPKGVTHNGGRLAFGPDGDLYVTTGDAGNGANSQNPSSLGGKILRITADGAPAPGNPTPGSPVWSLGHRNVQGIGWAADGTMYASEFGQNRLDELNRIVPGGNYGWPEVEGPGGGGRFINPLVTWPTDEASPSGLAVTADAVYLAALRGERLWRVPITGPGTVGTPTAYLQGTLGRLRNVVLNPDRTGLWVLTGNTFRGSPRAGDDRLVDVPLG
ncbi:MAG: PQQ-dependent sugar dehydrogenase [Actinomycetes bacterium]